MKRNIIIIVLLIIAVAGWYAYRLYEERTPDVVNKKPDVTITATDLLAAFDKDTANAAKRFTNKIIAVTGLVISADSSAIVLGEPNSQSSVVCGVDSRHRNDFKKIKIGSVATVQGNYVGFEKEEMLDVSLGTTVHLSFAGVKNKN